MSKDQRENATLDPSHTKSSDFSQQSPKALTLSNDIPLTDDYLDSILPTKGYRIVNPPAGYAPIKKEQVVVNEEDNPGLPRVPKEFIKLYTDNRPDDELTHDEKQERFVMKILMQIKDGTTYQRKIGLRLLTTHANGIGAKLIFSKLLPLLSSKVLSDHERHTFVKVVDRLIYRLSTSMKEYVPQLLAFMGKMLIESDPIARAEAREIVSNLAKISGLPLILQSLRSGLDSEDKGTRAITAQTIATAATAFGIPAIFPFLKAAIHTKKSWKIRHTGVRIIDSICFQKGNGILPFLNELTQIILHALNDDTPAVVIAAIKCITTMAEASAPFGGDIFRDIITIIWDGVKKYETHRACLKAVGALIMTMKQNEASFHFSQMYHDIVKSFSSTNNEDKFLSLIIFERSIQKGSVNNEQLEKITEPYFKAFWNQRTLLEKKIPPHLITVTTEIANRSSINTVINHLFYNFKQGSSELRYLGIQTFMKIIETCGTTTITQKQIEIINDNLIFALSDIKDGEEKKNKLYLKCLKLFVNSIGTRVGPLLQDIGTFVMNNLHVPKHRQRMQAAQILAIYSKSFVECDNKVVILHFYGVLQEFLGEDYPEVLAAVLEATNAILDVLKPSELDPPPDDIISRLIPIMKNRNEKASYACVKLIMAICQKTPTLIHKKEWMRICFELLELLKAEKKNIRMAAINTFAYIAKALGPFDVLLTLLNNLQVQERQIRMCTTTAIAVLAEKCGPYNILPALMNEYRTPDANVQNGSLKALQFLFQTIGSQCADYAYAVTPLLTHALIERDPVHRQIACQAVKNFALGLYTSGKEDILIHLLNHVMPNVLESSMHFINAVIDAIDAIRVSAGPGIVLQYTLGGLFHPARKVRSQYWRIYNNLIIYCGDSLVPFYPSLESTPTNEYYRNEFDIFV